MQTVGDLYENDADVLGHCHEHLAQIFHLLVFLAGVLHARELRDALNDVGHRLAELLCNIAVGKVGILNNIVQKRRNYRVLVKPHIGRYIRRRDAVGDIGRAVLAKLPGMGELCHVVCRFYSAHIHIHAAVGYFLAERGEHLVGIKFSVFCFCHYDRLAFKRFISSELSRLTLALPDTIFAPNTEPGFTVFSSPSSHSTIRHMQNRSGSIPCGHWRITPSRSAATEPPSA